MKTGILILLTSLVWNLQLSGQMIPENVTLKQLDGKEITFKEAVQQGPVIVSFWATWCKPCQSELEALKDLEDSWKNKVRIIAVSIDDARAMAKVKSLVKGKNGLSKYCSTRTKSYIKHSIFQQFPMF
nr:TlpA disulfide reductase family protein [Odoribacter splanchnicus]